METIDLNQLRWKRRRPNVLDQFFGIYPRLGGLLQITLDLSSLDWIALSPI